MYKKWSKRNKHKSDSPRKPAILRFKVLLAGWTVEVALFLEQGGLNSQLLYDRHIIEVGRIFAMQKFDRVQDRTYVIGDCRWTATPLFLGRNNRLKQRMNFANFAFQFDSIIKAYGLDNYIVAPHSWFWHLLCVMLASMIHHTLNIMFWTQFQPREFASANLQFYRADVKQTWKKAITTAGATNILRN